MKSEKNPQKDIIKFVLMKKLILANPRGFCAGVDRATHIVESALKKFGTPIYVRHEIVHNQFVVDNFKKQGVIFVENLSEIPEESIVIFSAHGVSDSVYKEALSRKLKILDATCPLVKKVHSNAKKHYEQNRHIIMIGHAGHAEVEGTLGQLPKGAITLVKDSEDVQKLNINNTKELAYITQTTLSVEETKETIAALKEKFPEIIGPQAGDLCYATGNRQSAVKKLLEQVDFLLVVGASNSSNSTRLCELGKKCNVNSRLIASVEDLEFSWLENAENIGLTSGASAPEILVQGVVEAIQKKIPDIVVENLVTMVENLHFNLPKELQD